MLDKAIDAYTGNGRSLADEPAYANMAAQMTPGSQSALLVDVTRILEALRPTLEKQGFTKEMGISLDDLLRLFGDGRSGLVGSGKYDGKAMTGGLFVPLDFERLIRLIGTTTRDKTRPNTTARL